MSKLVQLSPRLYFSYGQFFVYDSSVNLPGCLWTDAHIAQGFARRESSVCFQTLLEFGYADVSYCKGPFQPSRAYERVIAVPFAVSNGTVIVDGPDELNVQRTFELAAGSYRLVAAQRAVNDGEEMIVIFVEAMGTPLTASEMIVVDSMLHPPRHLLETADVA